MCTYIILEINKHLKTTDEQRTDMGKEKQK